MIPITIRYDLGRVATIQSLMEDRIRPLKYAAFLLFLQLIFI